MSRHPMVKWAQRPEDVFITIELPDAQDVKLKLEPEGKLFFSAISGPDKIPYQIDLDLYDKVDVNESKASIGLRNIRYLVRKGEEKWWNRLLKQEGKPPLFLKVDWDKWVDEDEEPESNFGADMDMNDFDFSNLNMGGAGVGAEEDDEDDDSYTEDEDEDNVEAEEVPGEKAEIPSSNGEPDSKAASQV